MALSLPINVPLNWGRMKTERTLKETITDRTILLQNLGLIFTIEQLDLYCIVGII